MQIEVVDRETGKVEIEKIYGHRSLTFLYGTSLFSNLFSALLLPLFAQVPWFSRLYGWLQRRKGSQKKIAPFIETFKVDASEFAEQEFSSFDDFFTRKLLPSARPIAPGKTGAILPADGRALVFPNVREAPCFYIKGQEFDLSTFLQNRVYARRFEEGAMLIVRLCPTDYHRFHFPVDGVPHSARLIPGALFSVSPLALRRRLSFLWENKRMITEIDTEGFGTLLYIEVGATCVGTIHQTYTPEKSVAKGDEKGYFSFGGSCLVLLFEKGRIAFDRDLILNSSRGFETKVKFGQSLGVASV